MRYFPERFHKTLAPEFAEELKKYGRIYMYRFRPDYEMYARPIDEYPHKSRQAAAIMLMIQNNLNPAVAQHPHELITYGGNGSVFMNWAQYLLTMQYLTTMTDEQTLVMYSGHPQGLFPSHTEAQPKACDIAGVVSVVAEVNPKAARKRHEQGWVDEIFSDLDSLIPRIRKAKAAKEVVSIAYEGNVVDLWERLDKEDIFVDPPSGARMFRVP